MGGSRDDARSASRTRTSSGTLGWAFALASICWAAALHQGLGPPPESPNLRWHEPSGFLLRSDFLAVLSTSFPLAFATFTLPAALLAAGVVAGTRSAIARAIALVCVVATMLFVFYGITSPYPWKFFGWRGSATLWLTAVCVGCSAASPCLASRWLRLPRWLRATVYLPIAFATVASIRNTTGTNEALKYAISPWPAVPVFGMEVGGLFVASALIGVAVAAGGYTGEGRRRHARVLLVALGLLLPLGIIASGAALGLFPFELGVKTLAGVALLCAVSLALVVALRSRDAETVRRRARAMATGAALVAIPIFAGQVLARIDYHMTREWRARSIIDALEHYAEREGLYPDSLADLVDAGDITAIPTPAIGFRLFGNAAFRYRNFGSSYVLEFEAPRWVECAYTPPYADEEAEESPGESALAEAWSCPSEPPELW